MTGERIGHYVVRGLLGSGGMRHVYLATDTRTGEAVALKVFSRRLAKNDEARRRLEREAMAVARLDHPRVVRLRAIEDVDGRTLVVEDYVEGESLEVRLARGALPADLCGALAWDIASALAHAHAAGVLHRDLKPANIMAAADGTFRLTDFGIARVVGAERITSTGVVLGSLPYLAPERILGGDETPACDVFAFGIVLYQALCGRHPFAGQGDAQVLNAIVNRDVDEPVPARGAAGDLPRVIRLLLEKNPAGRPADGQAILDALALATIPRTVA